MNDTLKRILFRLEDSRTEVQHLSSHFDYPQSSKLERAIDALETAEKYIKELMQSL